MKVLGLDISSAWSGWAVIEDGSLVAYGRIDIKSYKENNTIDNAVLSCFGDEVQRLLEIYKPDVVAVENIYFGVNEKVAILLSMMSGVARYLAYRQTNAQILTIFPSQVNALVGAPTRGIKRPERKKLIVEGINRLFKIKLLKTFDDQADAVGIAKVAYDSILNNREQRII